MLDLLWLPPDDDDTPFPAADMALRDPNGLLAIGGPLSPTRLERAYRNGIFPWFSEGQPVLWWSPDPRAVLFPAEIRISRSLRKRLRRNEVTLDFDQRFAEVMQACAAPRANQPGTWITDDMIAAYLALHARGLAHSVEVYQAGALVGGLYGVAIGGAFFGESMFSRQADASKIALVYLAAQLRRWGYRLIDCQVPSPHLASLGARLLPRSQFLALLDDAVRLPGKAGVWQFDSDLDPLGADAPTSI
jgi:leucyl/phenylalanyl-tRNA--protein transferase